MVLIARIFPTLILAVALLSGSILMASSAEAAPRTAGAQTATQARDSQPTVRHTLKIRRNSTLASVMAVGWGSGGRLPGPVVCRDRTDRANAEYRTPQATTPTSRARRCVIVPTPEVSAPVQEVVSTPNGDDAGDPPPSGVDPAAWGPGSPDWDDRYTVPFTAPIVPA